MLNNMSVTPNTPFAKRILHMLTPPCLVRHYRSYMENRAWKGRGFASPSTPNIKRAVLLREGFSDATWVESGTYLGETTALLAKNSKHVHTIEVAPVLVQRAQNLFKKNKKITIWEGDSGVRLAEILPTLEGNVNFWLDGHFSGAFTGKGEGDTPIVAELKAIEDHIKKAGSVNFVVMVDDVRCFGGDSAYPPLSFLAKWADQHAKDWHIEHDIFIAHVVK